MTLDDPYFLTEALYAPESQLTNIKRATLHIITIRPDKWSSDSDSAGSPSLSSEELSQSHGIAQQSLIHSTRTHRNSESSGSSTKVDEKLDGVCEDNELGKRRHCLSNIEAQEKSTDDVKQMCRDPTPIRSKIRKVEGKGDAFDDTTGQRKTDSSGEATGMVLPNRTPTAAGAGSSSFTDQRWLVELQEKLEGRPYILDIDLDFYSTKDPFQNECSPGLTTLLQQLFQFNLPAEKSEKVSSSTCFPHISQPFFGHGCLQGEHKMCTCAKVWGSESCLDKYVASFAVMVCTLWWEKDFQTR